mmetsp:Transcript_64841/g.127314  ORF Transcript_64841/g.127314 Transcript_64841/m.127314 type:complete len:125 (-) Transcript_64841:301-675(-)
MRVFALLCLSAFGAVNAFLPTTLHSSAMAGTTVVPRSECITMACRVNSKKEKRKRNKENMRQFKKPKVNKWSKFKPVTASSIKRAVAKQAENDFVSKLFTFIVAPEETEGQDNKKPRDNREKRT